ncbi:MAG: cytidine deaminase [Thaumarchaeota archaeon]|nr:MAG: cytidine deaminase [Nitrososphaerota archaeon]
MNRDDLIKKAREAKEFAYSPYSNFKVGAAILTENGEVFTGCNIENISYGATNCAERTAIFKAISDGNKSFKEIAISSSIAPEKPIFPCGICRQVLAEFNKDMLIHVDGDDKTYKLSELLPAPFDKNQMSNF